MFYLRVNDRFAPEAAVRFRRWSKRRGGRPDRQTFLHPDFTMREELLDAFEQIAASRFFARRARIGFSVHTPPICANVEQMK